MRTLNIEGDDIKGFPVNVYSSIHHKFHDCDHLLFQFSLGQKNILHASAWLGEVPDENIAFDLQNKIYLLHTYIINFLMKPITVR